MNMPSNIADFQKNLSIRVNDMKALLPSDLDVMRFLGAVYTSVKNDPSILKCNHDSIFNSCEMAAKDGLLLDKREAALIAYGNKCTYQPMVGGILKKFRSSNKSISIDVHVVHEKDKFSYTPGTRPLHEADWFSTNRGPIVGVYSVAQLHGGAISVEIMPMEEINKIKSVAKTKNVWNQWFEEKAKVACMKRHCKRLPTSTDIQQVFDHDNMNYELKDITPPMQNIEQDESIEASMSTDDLEVYKKIKALMKEATNHQELTESVKNADVLPEKAKIELRKYFKTRRTEIEIAKQNQEDKLEYLESHYEIGAQ